MCLTEFLYMQSSYTNIVTVIFCKSHYDYQTTTSVLEGKLGLKFRWKCIQLYFAEHWSVFANKHRTYIAASTFAYATLHAILKRSIYVLILETEFLEYRECKLDHDRRATDNSYCIVTAWSYLT